MLTIDKLKEFGVDTDSGIKRVMGKEDLYLSLVKTVPSNEGFAMLNEAVRAGDLDAAFEAAHGLKGILGNLDIKVLYDKLADITEKLRAREERDYSKELGEIEELRAELEDIVRS